MSGDSEAEFLFSGKAEMCEVHTVVRCWSTHSKCDRFGDLWIAVVRCWSNSNCDDLQAHCAAQGDAVWDVGRLEPECLLGDATRCEGALPAVGLQVRTLILHATGTRVPDTVLCIAVLTAPWVRAKLGTPWWKNPGDG